MSITKGDKIARAIAARYISPGGTEGIEVSFEFEEPSTGTRETMSNVFWLSDKSIQRSMEALTGVLGCNENYASQNKDTGVFTDPNFLDFKREVKLVVDFKDRVRKAKDGSGALETITDPVTGEVLQDAYIKWVNPIGGGAYAGVSVDQAGPGLKNLMASAIQRKTAKPVKNFAPVPKPELPF